MNPLFTKSFARFVERFSERRASGLEQFHVGVVDRDDEVRFILSILCVFSDIFIVSYSATPLLRFIGVFLFEFFDHRRVRERRRIAERFAFRDIAQKPPHDLAGSGLW